ncbi:MAG: M4 family metallopeptidase [Bacteroidia bacterium]|nr:M4 family metallopeptidase [Bacteroidia bacterium]
MKKIIKLVLCALVINLGSNAQQSVNLQNLSDEYFTSDEGRLNFIKFKASERIAESATEEFINSVILANSANKVVLLKTENDALGFTHKRFQIAQNGILLYNKIIIAHSKNGRVISLNGDLYAPAKVSSTFLLSEARALNIALQKVNAKKYKWENKTEETHMRTVLNQPDFSYYPKAQKVLFEKEENIYKAYCFNIYAEEPLYRANVFVDANSGKVLAEQNLICTINTNGSAATKYSGTQTLTCDQNGSNYRLRETVRGLGVETYNLNNTNTYAANDFTNATTTWTTINNNQAATDAHWGAESTYDYYMTRFNRNSIDNAGYKLLSYLHYNNNYNNAFWDGLRMTYGDGNGTTFTIFTALDVCGHEITHGLVSNSASLNGGGTGEADALNEAFADIFGTSIERFARPNNWNWKMGMDITVNGNGIRNMQNPKLLSDPDTYLGQYWDAAGEPHNNAGPCIKWFYLLVTGGSATNDLNNTYTVTGLGNLDAESIAYRALTSYFTPGTTYALARAYSIQAAKDLFGNCSNQVLQTANAWYAVGVGTQMSLNVVGPNFTVPSTNYCSMPVSVNFSNTTSNGLSYTWFFGDGASSTATNPAHTYTTNGIYSVKLKVVGCAGTDSITKNAYIVVNIPTAPVASGTTICSNTPVSLSASGNATIKWFVNNTALTPLATGNVFTTPPLFNTTTYYVANTIPNSPVLGGRTSISGGGFLNNNAQWLNFDVSQTCIINSVEVNAQAAGNQIVELRNASGVVLNSITSNLSVGINTVVLNFNVLPGTNFQLGLNASLASNLYRSNSGTAYPYNVGGYLNIIGSSAGSAYYYWFYNWKVTKADCSSQRIPVTVSITPATQPTVTAASTVVCLSDDLVPIQANPAGGVLSGTGISGNNFSPATGTGNYYIKYSYTSNGCLNSDSLLLKVDLCEGLVSAKGISSISVFPNPVKNSLSIRTGALPQTLFASLYDISGRKLIERELTREEEILQFTSYANGLYILSITDNSGRIIHSVKVVKE